jgi:hypothetical protein
MVTTKKKTNEKPATDQKAAAKEYVVVPDGLLGKTKGTG